MQVPSCRMCQVVELFGKENPFVARIIGRFGKSGVIDVVFRSPGTIGPMGAGFNDVVLKIVLMQENQTVFVGSIGELLQPAPIPMVVFGQIVFAETVVSRSLSAAGERLFVKRRPHIAVYPADTFVVVATAVVPQTVVVVDGEHVCPFHPAYYGINVVGQSCSGSSRHVTREMGRGCHSQIGWPNASAPPADVVFIARLDLSVPNQAAVFDNQWRRLWLRHCPDARRNILQSKNFRFACIYWNRMSGYYPVDPIVQANSRFACYLRQFLRQSNRGRSRSIGRNPDQIGTVDVIVSQAFFQLGIKQTPRLDMIIAVFPIAVAGKFRPGTERPVHGCGRSKTFHIGGRALPKNTVGGIPARSLIVLAQVGVTQGISFDVYNIKQYARRPTANRTAETVRQIGMTFNKSIGSGSTVTQREIMITVFRIQALKQALLPHREESVPALSADFRNGRKVFAIFHCNAFGRFRNKNRRAGKMLESHIPHPNIGRLGNTDCHPAVRFVFRILKIVF